MIEQRLADSFRAVVADEPPLGFDPDDIVDRAGQRSRRRRAVVGAAGATVVIAIAAIAAFSLRGPGGQTQVGGSDPSVTPTGRSSPAPSSPMAPPSDKSKKDRTAPPAEPTFPGSAEIVARLDQVGPQLLAEHVPDLTFNHPDGGSWHVGVEPRVSVGAAYPVTGTTHRYVTLSVWHDRDRLDLAADPAGGGGWGSLMSETPRSDGSYIRVYSSVSEGTGGIAVVHLRTDGVIAMADTTMKPEPGRTGFVVTEDVLVALATDPRLTF